MITSQVTDQKISLEDFAAIVSDESAGAIVLFSGNVRNHDHGKKVLNLIYEVHPSAPQVLEKIVKEIAADFDVTHIAAAHRFGDIPIGESAFIVAVSSHHREAAFECARTLVDLVKKELPIWKHQKFEDGSDEWVNSA